MNRLELLLQLGDETADDWHASGHNREVGDAMAGYLNEIAKVAREDRQTIWVADWNSGKYDWLAFGATRDEALDALRSAWAHHVKVMTDAGRWIDADHLEQEIRDDAVPVLEYEVGAGYLDHSKYGEAPRPAEKGNT